MDDADLQNAMLDLLRREHADGCCMATDVLIEPAIRRLRSYDRRNVTTKHKTLEHRTNDLYKALIELFPNHTYDPTCLRHISESFAAIFANCQTSSNAHSRSKEKSNKLE